MGHPSQSSNHSEEITHFANINSVNSVNSVKKKGEKKFLTTSALPYANGPIHFGHLAGAYLSADVFNRHHRLMGNKTLFICGSDEHGVAIMLNAKKANCDYQSYVDKWHEEHERVFKKYGVEFDFFGQTSAKYHEEETVKWFHALNEKGLIGTKDGQQLFCKDCKNHLPDRFVEGRCYNCGYESARGDECPQCGELIDSIRLIGPVCKICGSHNIKEVTVTQYYLLLSQFHREYRKWFEAKKSSWRKTVWPYVDSLTKDGLHDRAISRDLDWGIDVPLPHSEGKKLYVWFDAPIGYVSNTKELLRLRASRGEPVEDYLRDWWQNEDVELTHFIGKDNIIFHSIIFPVMSLASSRAMACHDVPANQFLNLEGKQFSKSTGHYVDALSAVDEFGQDALRYYLLSILPEQTDSNFSWQQFQAKVNNELANNIGNFLNRCLKFTKKNWPKGMKGQAFKGFSESEQGELVRENLSQIREYLKRKQIKKALEQVMVLGQRANNYFSDAAPWALIKENRDEAERILAYSTLYALCVGVSLAPFLPHLSSEILLHFKERIDREAKRRIYLGDLRVLDEIFSEGHRFENEVLALVPKIRDEQIAVRLEELDIIRTE